MIGRTLRLYRNAYRGLAPSVWILSGVMLINRSGTMVLPYPTLYLTQHLHYSITDAGIVMAVYGSGALVGTFLGGRLSDKWGFYSIQVFSLLISGFFLISLQFIQDFYAMCGVVFAYTTLGDAFRPANSAAIAHYSVPENRTRAYSLNRLAINLGWSFGGGLGGYLAGINYSLLFWVDGLTCIVAALVLRLALQPPTTSPALHSTTESGDSEGGMSPYRDRLYRIFVLATILFAVAFMQLFSLVPLYFKQVLHLTETQIGLLMTMNGLMIVAVEMALVYSIEKHYARQKVAVIRFGILLVGLSYLLLNTGYWPGIAIIMVIINTIGEMLAMPFMQSFTVERASARYRGQYLGLYSMAYAVAQISAPAFGSQVAAHAGFPTLWMALMGLCVIAASGFWWIARQAKAAVVESSFAE